MLNNGQQIPPARTGVGRVVLQLVAAGLCVAALAAVTAILTGDFDGADGYVIGTSVLFALASATGGAGAALVARRDGAAFGAVVIVASTAMFALGSAGMWLEIGGDTFWRITGAAAIVAVDGAHAAYVMARRSRFDAPPVGVVTRATVGASALSAAMGLLAVMGVADDGPWQPLAIVLIVQLLGTALAPILRRTSATAMTRIGAPARSLGDDLALIAAELEAGVGAARGRELADRLRGIPVA